MAMDHEVENNERTSVLANERTYSAWIRTGITALAAGLGFEKFLGSVLPETHIRILSMVLLGFSFASFFLAAWRYQHVGRRMVTTSVSGAPVKLLVGISVILMLSSLLAIIGIWMM